MTMERHPLDPIALIGGLLAVLGAVIALLHQTEVIDLGPAPVTLIALIAIGVAGAALMLLANRPAP